MKGLLSYNLVCLISPTSLSKAAKQIRNYSPSGCILPPKVSKLELSSNRSTNEVKCIIMQVAILSDIHDHLDKLNSAIEIIKSHSCEQIIFCGDMVSPFMTGVLSRANLPTFACLGNNDEDHIGMVKKGGNKFTWFHLSQEFGQTTIDDKKIAFCHYPKLGELLAKAGEFDAVFFGHTHEPVNKTVGKTLLLNPGAVCGINFDTGKYEKATLAIYNTTTNTAEIIEVK